MVSLRGTLRLSSSPPRTRTYLRVGPIGGEGIGSLLMHFKQSIILSLALGDVLILGWTDVLDHRYSVSEIFNRHAPASGRTLELGKTCRIQDYMSHEERGKLTRGWCAGDKWAIERLQRLSMRIQDCTGIVDLAPGKHELVQDLNGCIMPWIRSRLIPHLSFSPLPYASASSPIRLPRPISVGVHIRWGDVAAPPGTDLLNHHFYGSFNLPQIISVLADIRAFAGRAGIALTIAMEDAEPSVLELLGEKEGTYRLLDSGHPNAVQDMIALSQNDVLLLGPSSFGAMVHLIAPRGLTLVAGTGATGKFANTTAFGRHVVYMRDYTPATFELLWKPVR
ncbi:hypothetical protein R3P38DRAFT_2603029 [Favolaschia claudopus]|uniref:Uncharacterized protein n=1 Tax=Favolaschia claudopus TaxID=2862362 RepID=A0AAW0DKP7_9AGAR